MPSIDIGLPRSLSNDQYKRIARGLVIKTLNTFRIRHPEKGYLHWSGTTFTENKDHAWSGTAKQLRAIWRRNAQALQGARVITVPPAAAQGKKPFPAGRAM